MQSVDVKKTNEKNMEYGIFFYMKRSKDLPSNNDQQAMEDRADKVKRMDINLWEL